MASVTEIADQLHRLVRAGLVKPADADPMVYVDALRGFQVDVLEAAVGNFLRGLYREHNAAFYPSAPQLADYCRRVQGARYEAGYGDRFDQRVRESRAALAAWEKTLADRTPEMKARVQALCDSVKGSHELERDVQERLQRSYVRHKYNLTPEALANIPDADGGR